MLEALAPIKTSQILRPYQVDCVRTIQTAWARKVENRNVRALASLATGAGKTTILAQLLLETVDPAKHRALIIAHVQEIIHQLQTRIENQFDGALGYYYGPTFSPGIGIVMGAKDAADARIVIATRQSLHEKRLAEVLSHGPFDVFIVDEAHHAHANSYMDILKGVAATNPDVKVAGFTATPKRSDRKALKAYWDEIVYEWTILSGIQGGYLVPVTRRKIKTSVEAGAIKTREGDYDQKELIAVLDASNWVELAVKAYRDYVESTGRQCIAFFPQVAMSQLFVRRLRNEGIAAAHIDATTPKEERAHILREYQRGAIKIVSNMQVLTEGWDGPATAAILWARPTRSEVVLTQAVGRGLRLYPGKTDCLMIDLTVADTKALQVGTLLGRMITCKACQTETYKGFKTCPTCGADLAVEAEKQERKEGLGIIYHDGKGRGAELSDEIVSLFNDLAAAWHKDKDSEIFTCAVGYSEGAMVIAPPTFADNADRLRERLDAGKQKLADPTLAPYIRDALVGQMARLERELRRIDHYSLYYVSAPDPVTGVVWVEYVRANTDLASLMLEADSEVLRRTSSANMVKRSSDWRSLPATPGQVGKLRAIGARGWRKGMTRGEAAALITHHETLPLIREWLTRDVLPERKQ